MPLIVPLITVPVASPIMSLFGVANFAIVVGQYWRDLSLKDIWRMTLAAMLFLPLGIYILFIIPENRLRLTLGIFVIVYALYRLFKLPFPELKNPNWGWVAGIFAGIASGAFSLGGIPGVIYADTQEWEPDRFRLNMFTFFLINGIYSVIVRYFAGQITGQVLAFFGVGLPFMLAGLYVGTKLADRVNRDQFRKLVLFLLIILGGRLLFSAL